MELIDKDCVYSCDGEYIFYSSPSILLESLVFDRQRKEMEIKELVRK